MKEQVIITKLYKRLLRKYNKDLPFTEHYPIEFLLMAYDSGNTITYPFCLGFPALRLIQKRCGLNVLIINGYLTKVAKYKYKLTIQAEWLCRKFNEDFKAELKGHQINPNL
jgi:hypothetical protein